MEYARRQKRLPGKGRRVILNCNLTPHTHYTLGQIASGNRSAAIEYLVERYLGDLAADASIRPLEQSN
jgi:hypothetical protein